MQCSGCFRPTSPPRATRACVQAPAQPSGELTVIVRPPGLVLGTSAAGSVAVRRFAAEPPTGVSLGRLAPHQFATLQIPGDRAPDPCACGDQYRRSGDDLPTGSGAHLTRASVPDAHACPVGGIARDLPDREGVPPQRFHAQPECVCPALDVHARCRESGGTCDQHHGFRQNGHRAHDLRSTRRLVRVAGWATNDRAGQVVRTRCYLPLTEPRLIKSLDRPPDPGEFEFVPPSPLKSRSDPCRNGVRTPRIGQRDSADSCRTAQEGAGDWPIMAHPPRACSLEWRGQA